jgi:hypothetical protein
MKFGTRVTLHAHPDLNLRIDAAPLAFECHGSASFPLSTGPFEVSLKELPISLAIPFLRRRHRRVVVASVGPVRLRLNPIDVKLEARDISIGGVVGKEGISSTLHGTGACKAEIGVTGKVPIKALGEALDGSDSE